MASASCVSPDPNPAGRVRGRPQGLGGLSFRASASSAAAKTVRKTRKTNKAVAIVSPRRETITANPPVAHPLQMHFSPPSRPALKNRAVSVLLEAQGGLPPCGKIGRAHV